jgi:hypothetical protein
MSLRSGDGIILAVQSHAKALTLRCDRVYVSYEHPQGIKPVIVLTLETCEDLPDRVLPSLPVGTGVYYEMRAESDGSYQAELFADYGEAEAIKLGCVSATETEDEYTVEDLRLKYQWLLEKYDDLSKDLSQLRQQHSALTNGLRNEIAKELDRGRRKLEFLSTCDTELNAGKIEKLQGQRDAFRRVLTIMTYLKQP